MALESRNGRTYYYTSERVGRTVLKRYRGAGWVATTLAELDAIDGEGKRHRALMRKDRATWRKMRAANRRAWFARVNAVVAEALAAAGWHQHKRGEWRRKRGAPMDALVTTTVAHLPWHGPDLTRAAGALDAATAEKAAKGDSSVAAAVDAYLANPAATALWGDMGRRVLRRWVCRYAGTCLTTELALLKFAADLRDRLAGPAPDALVQLVAERVVLAWVAVTYFENQYAATLDGMLIPHHKFHTARIELAHRTLMAACRTLAKVKKAKLPDVVALVSVTPPAAAVRAAGIGTQPNT